MKIVLTTILMLTVGATCVNAQADKLPIDRVWQFARKQLKETVTVL